MCKGHREQLWVGAVYIIRIFYCNTLLFCSSHTSSRITSAPMNCFVMLSQILVNILNHDPRFHEALISQLDETSHTILKVTFTGYGFLNLDYFRYFIPPFCVSQNLKNIHVLALQYFIRYCSLLLHAVPQSLY